jgi:hypothetical protein
MVTYTNPSIYSSSNIPSSRLFIGIDGRWMISDKHGTHVASPLAVALLNRAEHRATGYRAEVGNE